MIKYVKTTIVVTVIFLMSFLIINHNAYGNTKHDVTHGNDAGDLKNVKSVALAIQKETVNTVV